MTFICVSLSPLFFVSHHAGLLSVIIRDKRKWKLNYFEKLTPKTKFKPPYMYTASSVFPYNPALPPNPLGQVLNDLSCMNFFYFRLKKLTCYPSFSTWITNGWLTFHYVQLWSMFLWRSLHTLYLKSTPRSWTWVWCGTFWSSSLQCILCWACLNMVLWILIRLFSS